MADHTLPGIGLKGGWALGEDNWDVDMNANLVRASALTQLRVLSQTTALPGSPTNGDIYIVPAADGTNPNKIAVRDSGAWTYITPSSGWHAFVVDTKAQMSYNGAVWTNEVTSIADISATAAASVAGAVTLNRATGEIKRISASGNITSMDFSGWPPANTFARIILELAINAHTIALPTVNWSGGVTPTLQANNVFVFFTTDGGTTVRGATVWQGA